MSEYNGNPAYSNRVICALESASEWHRYQLRYDGLPYLSHLLRVMGYVMEYVKDEDVIISAVLHDVIQDVGVSGNLITRIFGERVEDMIMRLTEDKSLPREKRKEGYIDSISNPDTTWGSVLISMMDKYDNMRSYVYQPHLIRPDVIDFNKKLMSIYESRSNELPNEGVRSYGALLEEMGGMIHKMESLISD